MKPGDLVQTSARHGFITLFGGPPDTEENTIARTNMGHKQLGIVLGLVGDEALIMVPRPGGDVIWGWRESRQFTVVADAQ